MEIAIVLFLGVWLSISGVLGYIALKKDFKNITKDDTVSVKENTKGKKRKYDDIFCRHVRCDGYICHRWVRCK